MNIDHPTTRWLKRLERSGPVYLGILKALDGAIRDGELQAGDQLPPQRVVAGLLGVDFTTVTRAYGLARERGLVEGAVGRGTFVKGRPADDEVGLVDLSMNLPPQPEGLSLAKLLKEATRSVLDRTDVATLMAYHPGAGSMAQRSAAAAWLAPCLGEVDPRRIMVCAGAQTGLAALLTTLARPGEAVVVEPLTYPGVLSLAADLGLRLLPCPIDDQGFAPEALERLCATERVAAVYCTPTFQNPLAYTMGTPRRRSIAAVIAAAGATLIEDDAYGRLPGAPSPAIASFAPERSWYISTLSKCLSPGLRIAFMVAPDAVAAERVGAALRSLSMMPSPLMSAVATAWIREGVAEALLDGVRAEATARRAIAADILPAAKGGAESLHVWLEPPARWDPARLQAVARDRRLSLVGAESFAAPAHLDGAPRAYGVRISLGGPSRRAVLAEALRGVAAIVASEPPHRRALV